MGSATPTKYAAQFLLQRRKNPSFANAAHSTSVSVVTMAPVATVATMAECAAPIRRSAALLPEVSTAMLGANLADHTQVSFVAAAERLVDSFILHLFYVVSQLFLWLLHLKDHLWAQLSSLKTSFTLH